MKWVLFLFAFFLRFQAHAQPFTMVLHAPDHAGQVVRLYRYDDLFTLRTVRLADGLIGGDGRCTLTAEVNGTTKLQLRIGDVASDLFGRPGTTVRVRFPLPDPSTNRSINGTTRVAIDFEDMDALDVNALTSDLNERVDAFIAEDLATDQVAGMQALNVRRTQDEATDTLMRERPPTLFVTPILSIARVDTFERKLRRFYAEVGDPWFAHYLDHSMAGLRQGTRVTERDTYERAIKGRPLHYDDPEQVRFLRSFFAELLPAFALREHEADLLAALARADADSVKAVFARHDFLKNDDRLCELVTMDQLYLHYHAKYMDRAAVRKMLTDRSTSSTYPEHRSIAANMLWDLTAMQAGSALPAMLLEDVSGNSVTMDSLLNGPVCLVITASWCTYCALEMAALAQLHTTYKGVVPVIAISLDSTLKDMNSYRKAHPEQDMRWLHAVAGTQLREDLRIRSLPAIYLLNDGVLARSPAPLPSEGLGALFHQAQVEAERNNRIKVWDE